MQIHQNKKRQIMGYGSLRVGLFMQDKEPVGESIFAFFIKYHNLFLCSYYNRNIFNNNFPSKTFIFINIDYSTKSCIFSNMLAWESMSESKDTKRIKFSPYEEYMLCNIISIHTNAIKVSKSQKLELTGWICLHKNKFHISNK